MSDEITRSDSATANVVDEQQQSLDNCVQTDESTEQRPNDAETVNIDRAEEIQKKQKRKLPHSIKKFADWLKAHENIRQMLFFFMFSLICFAIEYITYAVLSACLKNVNRPINWFVFRYDTSVGGLGAFIAFLISNVIAQICTFILNRKKTFNATNNIVIAAIMYALLVAIIIVLNTYLGGVITEAIAKTKPGDQTIYALGGYVSKFVGSFLSFVINFLGCKFLVMRNWGSKKKTAVETLGSDYEQISPVDETTLAESASDIEQ